MCCFAGPPKRPGAEASIAAFLEPRHLLPTSAVRRLACAGSLVGLYRGPETLRNIRIWVSPHNSDNSSARTKQGPGLPTSVLCGSRYYEGTDPKEPCIHEFLRGPSLWSYEALGRGSQEGPFRAIGAYWGWGPLGFIGEPTLSVGLQKTTMACEMLLFLWLPRPQSRPLVRWESDYHHFCDFVAVLSSFE